MKYIKANQKKVTELNNWCRERIIEVQKKLKEYFTFDIHLIGSGEKRLVSQDENGNFDLDYNLILQKDKKNLIKNPKEIKKLFIKKFEEVLKTQNKQYVHSYDRTSVISNKLKYNGINFKFDVAILYKENNDCYYKLINDSNGDHYIWNQEPKSKNYMQRYLAVKKKKKTKEFELRYFELKNNAEIQKAGIKSFSLFLEVLNEFEQ